MRRALSRALRGAASRRRYDARLLAVGFVALGPSAAGASFGGRAGLLLHAARRCSLFPVHLVPVPVRLEPPLGPADLSALRVPVGPLRRGQIRCPVRRRRQADGARRPHRWPSL